MTDQPTRVRDAIADALADALADEGEMLNGWVTIIETIDGDGARGLWTAAAPDMRYWQTLGLLDAARMQEWHLQGRRDFA